MVSVDSALTFEELLNKPFNTKIMGNLLYIVAVILIIGWAVGFFAFQTSGIIHVLLVIALIAVIFRVISGRRAV